MARRAFGSFRALILAGVSILATTATSEAVETGDIVVTDHWYGLLFAEISTGDVHRFGTSAPVGDGLGGVVTDASGQIYALLAYAGVVFRIDATTGAYTTVAQGGFLQYPRHIALLPDGDLLVTESGSSGGVIRIDPGSGAQNMIHSGGAWAITASSTGVVHVLLRDPSVSVGAAYLLYRIDPQTGDTLRVGNTYFQSAGYLATEADGNLILTQTGSNSVLRIYPVLGGAVQLLTSAVQLDTPAGVAIEDDGTIVVTSTYGLPGCSTPSGSTCVGALVRIDPVSGAQTAFTSMGGYWRLGGIDLYRGPSVITPARTVTWGRVKSIYR